MLVAGILIFSSGQRFRDRAQEVTAVISEIDSYREYSRRKSRHDVFVTYTYGGRLYENVELNYYSSDMYEGKEITILCDPDAPGNIQAAGGMALFYFTFVGMGCIYIIVGGIPVIFAVRGSSRKKKLLQSGRKLYATVEKIDMNYSYSVNKRHPYVVYCTYRDDYKDTLYRFKSGNLWTDPSLALRPGDMVPVYVEEKNFRRYYVDVESCLEGRIVDYT